MVRPILITPGSEPSLASAYARPRFIRKSLAVSGMVKNCSVTQTLLARSSCK
jgi:hypothetical protein